MLDFILDFLINIIINLINSLGLFGIYLLMFIHAAGIPLPAEVTMPFAGFMASKGFFNFWLVVITGSAATLSGGLLAYIIGNYGGEPLIQKIIQKFGKYLLITQSDFNKAKKWFEHYGEKIIFLGQILPVVRTFISLPAGVANMNIKKFALYTFLGSFISCLGLTWLGNKVGENWTYLGSYFRKFDLIIVICILGLGGWYITHKLKKVKEN